MWAVLQGVLRMARPLVLNKTSVVDTLDLLDCDALIWSFLQEHNCNTKYKFYFDVRRKIICKTWNKTRTQTEFCQSKQTSSLSVCFNGDRLSLSDKWTKFSFEKRGI